VSIEKSADANGKMAASALIGVLKRVALYQKTIYDVML
jgi:hypothetical protein